MGSVLLILRKAWKAEKRQSTIARAFGRQKVSVMTAAVVVDQFDPSLGELFKGVDFLRVDHVIYDARYHRVLSSLSLGCSDSGILLGKQDGPALVERLQGSISTASVTPHII
jgi:hypothetical protein